MNKHVNIMKLRITFFLLLCSLSNLFGQHDIKYLKSIELKYPSDGYAYSDLKGAILLGQYYHHLHLYSTTGELLSKDTFTSTMTASYIDTVAVTTKIVNSREKWGVITNKGEVLFPFKYDEIKHFIFDHTSGKKGKTNYVLGIDGSEKKVNEKIFDMEFVMPNVATFRYRDGGNYNLVDSNGEIIPLESSFSTFTNSRKNSEDNSVILVQFGEYEDWMLNSKGKLIAKGKVGSGVFYDDYIQIDGNRTNRAHIFKLNGKSINTGRYSEISYFGNGKYTICKKKVGKTEMCGVLNRKFKSVIPCKYSSLRTTNVNDYFVFSEKGKNYWSVKYGLIDINENVLIKPNYSEINVVSENFVMVKEEDTWKWLDMSKRKVLAKKLVRRVPSLFQLHPHKNLEHLKLFAAQKKYIDGVSIYDEAGEIISGESLYKSVTYFWEHGALVCENEQGGSYFLMDEQGKILLRDMKKIRSFDYNFEDVFKNRKNLKGSNLIFFLKNDRYGIAKFDGTILIEEKYKNPPILRDGKYIWFLEGKEAHIYEIIPDGSLRFFDE